MGYGETGAYGDLAYKQDFGTVVKEYIQKVLKATFSLVADFAATPTRGLAPMVSKFSPTISLSDDSWQKTETGDPIQKVL